MEVDHEAVGREGAVRGGQALGLHRALDPPLQLDGLESCTEQARGRTLEEAFEEPLDGGQRRHGRSRSLAGGPARPPLGSRVPPDHPQSHPKYPRRRGVKVPAVYSRPCSSGAPAQRVQRIPGVLMPEILTESFCERCGTRYTFESAAPGSARTQGTQGRLARSEELRHVRRHVDGRSVRRGPQRDGPRGHLAAARRLPQDVQLLHVVPPVHVRQLLERGRGPLPVVRPAPRPGDPRRRPFPDLAASGGAVLSNGANGYAAGDNGHDELSSLDAMAWPTTDLLHDAEAEARAAAEAEAAARPSGRRRGKRRPAERRPKPRRRSGAAEAPRAEAGAEAEARKAEGRGSPGRGAAAVAAAALAAAQEAERQAEAAAAAEAEAERVRREAEARRSPSSRPRRHDSRRRRSGRRGGAGPA